MANWRKLLPSIVLGSFAGALAVSMVPEYFLHPNREAPLQHYTDAKKVFNGERKFQWGSEPDQYELETVHGACPDLSMQTAKALLDKRLTIKETHDLRVEAQRLQATEQARATRNEALVAAGQKPVGKPIDCPDGDELFR